MASLGLNIGLKSLLTAQSALDTVGHNLANVNTPGYSRQRLGVSASSSMMLRGLNFGGGVEVGQITRTVDLFLQSRITTQVSLLAGIDSQLANLGEMEALMGEPGDFGLTTQLESFFLSVSELAAGPEDPVLRRSFVDGGQSLAGQLNQISGDLAVLMQDSIGQARTLAKQVNVLAGEIASLNIEIASQESTGQAANDLRDQRDQALKELANYVNTTHNESANGTIQVHVSGQLLVGQTRAYEMSAQQVAGGVEISIQGNSQPTNVTSGSLGGLLSFIESSAPGLSAKLDDFAHNLILEVNRAHSTGIPAAGAFHKLTGTNAIVDQDQDGDFTDEALAAAGLPFDIATGELHVNLLNEATGEVQKYEVRVQPGITSVGRFLDDISSIPHLAATVGPDGRVQIQADAGYGFDFSNRLDTSPDNYGSFGGGHASITSGAGPYTVTPGGTLEIAGSTGPISVSFASGDFANPAAATAEEIAAVINADSDVALNGLRAVVVADRVVLQTEAEGSGETFTITGGSVAGSLGFAAGTVVTGHDTSVGVSLEGTYSGGLNDRWTFRPNMDGTIGTTPGLQIDVVNENGQTIATLDVGEGYEPGSPLTIQDGIRASFTFGELSDTDGDVFQAALVTDSDTSDVLVALGLNSYFTGQDASDIAVRQELVDDPSLVAASSTGAEGDNGSLLELLRLEAQGVGGLSGLSLGEYLGDVVNGVAFEIEGRQEAREIEGTLLTSLEARRDQVSGVNVDEELVNMIQFEQAYQAATRYIQVINDITDELLSLV